MKKPFPTLRIIPHLLATVLLLPGCERAASLPNGYKVVRLSSQEVALEGGKYSAFVAGPKLAWIGSESTPIFGEIELMSGRPSKLSDTPGYFILDTTTGVIEKGLIHKYWITKLHAAGISGTPKLAAP